MAGFGVLELQQDDKTIKYCLIPSKLAPAFSGKEYFPGQPLTTTPRLNPDRTRFVNPRGHEVADAVPIFEADFWTPEDMLYTIERWPCYPINFGLFSKLPLSLIDLLIQNTRTDWQTGSGKGTYQVSWGGLPLTREYQIDELGVGAAIWPRRALPQWTQFFMLFAPGNKDVLKSAPFGGSPTNPEIEPVVYALNGDRLVAGETAIVYGGKGAMSRSKEVPRMLAFKARGARDPQHGIMPLICSPVDGAFSVPTPGDAGKRRSVFSALRLPEIVMESTGMSIAVDFGTTHTAVAVAPASGSSEEVLQFSDDVLAKNLTEGWLDPALLLEARFGFFSTTSKPTNPLSSVIIEIDSRLQPFPGLSSLPRRSILGESLVDSFLIEAWLRDHVLKHEFKWQQDAASDTLRAAFLEMLARLVGWELRTQPRYRILRKALIIFTCPLSFSNSQTEQLRAAQDHFKRALEDCGFDVSLRDGLVSESLANLYLIRKQKTGVGSDLPEERHVVIDIGGGSTDISVFTGDGRPLWLDSLYIGGKDLAEVVVLRRLLADGSKGAMTAALQAALKTIFGRPVDGWRDELTGWVLNQFLLLRFGLGMEDVAKSFQGTALEGTPADFLTLLVFVTVYGVRMASLPGADVPKGTEIRVWFVGLGSRLFELSPLARMMNHRLGSAKRVLEAACQQVLPAGATASFDWRQPNEAKLTVCRGALLVPDHETGLELRTLFWADFPSMQPKIAWSDRYERGVAAAITDEKRRHLSIDALAECIGAAITSVSSHLGFDAAEADVATVKAEMKKDYSKGLGRIANRQPNAPPHPVTTATDGLKERVAGLMNRPRLSDRD